MGEGVRSCGDEIAGFPGIAVVLTALMAKVANE